MTNLTIEMPDNLARGLEGIASAQGKSVEQLALEQLSSLISALQPGSPEAVLRMMYEPPHLTASDVDDLDAVLSAGRLRVRPGDLFSTDPS